MSSDRQIAELLEVADPVRTRMLEWQADAHAELMRTLPRGEPAGYLYDAMQVLPSRSGKGLRPLLCLAACNAFGGTATQALPFAVSLEMMHLAFLVHDDVQDGSLRRRGGPALHEIIGMPLAVNVGDAYVWSATSSFGRALQALPHDVASAVRDRWDRAMRETLEGQALDLGWQRDGEDALGVEQYLAMAAKKTAWYSTVLPMSMGAAIGSGNAADIDRLLSFGWMLGLMFQVGNDLAGLAADPGEGDIEEGKRTLLVVQLLHEVGADDRRELLQLLRAPRDRRGPDEVAWVRSMMERFGVVDMAKESLCALAGAALIEAERAVGGLPATPGRDVLLAATAWLLAEEGQLADFGYPSTA